MINIITINNGLYINDQNMFFTKSFYNNGYRNLTNIQTLVELDEQFILCNYTDMSINGILYNNQEDFIQALGL